MYVLWESQFIIVRSVELYCLISVAGTCKHFIIPETASWLEMNWLNMNSAVRSLLLHVIFFYWNHCSLPIVPSIGLIMIHEQIYNQEPGKLPSSTKEGYFNFLSEYDRRKREGTRARRQWHRNTATVYFICFPSLFLQHCLIQKGCWINFCWTIGWIQINMALMSGAQKCGQCSGGGCRSFALFGFFTVNFGWQSCPNLVMSS